MYRRLTMILKPLSFALVMLTASLLQAYTVPDVDLLDAKGARVAQASVREKKGKCHIQLRSGKLRAGTYRFRLTHAKCAAPECAPQTVAETTPFEVLGDGTLSAWVNFPGVKDSGGLEELLRKGRLVLEALPADKETPSACGRVERWFSAFRDSRRGDQ